MSLEKPSISRVAAAYGVHLFTGLGAVCGVLSLLAIMRGDWRQCLLWNVVAMIIDGADGTFARRAKVKEVLPEFDGALLDNLIDYLNYVVVPALLIHVSGVLPASTSLLAASAIVLSSAYQFCQREAKTPDHFFKGFPSYWNVVALYALVLEVNPWVKLISILAFAVLVFVPIKYLYPSRTRVWKKTTMGLTIVWGCVVGVMLFSFPAVNQTLAWLSLVYIAYYMGASVYFTFRPTGG